jgi:thiamine pyrophosphokinase
VSIIEDPDQYSTDFTKCLKYLNSHATEIITSPRHQKKRPSNKNQESGVSNTLSSQSTLEIVILGGLGGRVDQAFSQIHHLYMMTQTQRQLRESQESNQKLGPGAGGNLYLISEESITFVLQEGKNIIYTPATNRPDTDAPVDQDSIAKENQPPLKRKRDQETDAETEYFFEENIGIIPLSAPASITTQGFEWDVEDWHTEIGGQLSTSNHIRADKVEVLTSVPVLFTVELAQRLKRA